MPDHDKDNWPRANHETGGVLLIAAIAIAVIMGLYAMARHMIGLPL